MREPGRRVDTAQLVAEHHQAIYRYACRLSGDTADAEDLVQQVFLIAHEHAHEVRDADRVRSWLYAVLRSCYSRHRRRRQPLPAASVDLDVNLVATERPPDSLDQGQLQRAIDALDDDFKIVVMLFYFEYQSYRQIAETLDIPLGTVMSRLARAKAQLRRRLFQPDPPERTLASSAALLSRQGADRPPRVGSPSPPATTLP